MFGSSIRKSRRHRSRPAWRVPDRECGAVLSLASWASRGVQADEGRSADWAIDQPLVGRGTVLAARDFRDDLTVVW
jgi:hypothetical protein